MEFLADTWILWLVITVVTMMVTSFVRQGRGLNANSEMATADDFSIKTVLLGFRKGEGDLFIGFCISMVSFSLFLAGIMRWVRTIFF